MSSEIISFEESEYKWWDTYEDIFKEPEIINAVEHTVKFLEDCDETFTGRTYGDKIRFIFMREHGIAELLKHIRESSFFNIWFDVRKMIALVLVIEDMKNLILKYPNSVTDLVKINVLNIVADATDNVISMVAEDEEGDKEERTTSYSKHERLEFLIEAWFPIITTEGDVVMGYKPFDGKSLETAIAWDDNLKTFRYIDKDGREIQTEENAWDNEKPWKGQKFWVIEWGKK